MKAVTISITIDEEELKELDFKEQPEAVDVCEAVHEAIYLAYARI